MTDELREDAPHAPVLLAEVVAALAPARGGLFLDGTFGAGGYAGAVLDAGADRVIAVDRDPTAIAGAAAMTERYGARLTLVEGRFGDLAEIAADHSGGAPLTGVCLDIGVSSMQIDQAERGFSFLRDGPLDMRMERAGRSAADLVNQTPEDALADLIYDYGEERASRRIARRICERRKAAPFARTLDLAEVVAGALPRPKPGQIHPATRTFQALRIAVNDELGELERALAAAELALAEGGVLAVVTFHSLEDRIVKRFLAEASGAAPAASRHAPETAREAARFELTPRKPVAPGAEEIARNPRARSARLRAARRTGAPARRAPEPYRRKGAGA